MLNKALKHSNRQQSEPMIIKNVTHSENAAEVAKKKQLVIRKNNNEHYDLQNENENENENQTQQQQREKLRRSNENATKSSRALAFCESCCRERQQEPEQQQQHEQLKLKQKQRQKQPGIVAFYRSYADSVSDLSSYRFVSDEEEASDNDADADNDYDDDDADDDDDVGVSSLLVPCIEIEQREPKTSTTTQQTTATTTTTTATTETTDKALKKAKTSYASSLSETRTSRSVSPIICCYKTIDKKRNQRQLTESAAEQPGPCWPDDSRGHYNIGSYLRSYRRYPPPVPPKPKYRICLEVTACSGFPDAEPALKTRRVESAGNGKLTYPLTCPLSPCSASNPLTSTANHNRGDGNGDEISSCCDWQNAPVAAENSCKLHAIETNNNNYNCKLEPTSNGALQSNKTNRTCILRYDRYGHLKQEISSETEPVSVTVSERAETEINPTVTATEKRSEYDLTEPSGRKLSHTNLAIADVADVHIDLNLSNDLISDCNEKGVFIDSLNRSANVSLHSNSTFASISLHNLTYANGCLVDYTIPQHTVQFKQLPVIQTFDCSAYAYSPLGQRWEAHQRTMDKRRNTLDRFQRLTFGRKSSSSAGSDGASNSNASGRASGADKNRKTSDRSERLKELTELLRGSNSSRASSTPTPPPIPPPRRPRISHIGSGTSSIEMQDVAATTAQPVSACADDRDESCSQLQKQNSTNSSNSNNSSNNNSNNNNNNISGNAPSTAARLFHSIRPNTSLSNLEAFMLGNREKSKSSPPLAVGGSSDEVESASSEWATQLSGAETRSGINTINATKAKLPFRSVSFSQIDCKSTLSALRDRLRRDKAIEAPTSTATSTSTSNYNSNSNTSSCNKPNESVDRVNDRTRIPDPGWVHIPLKSSGLCINLNYGQEKSLEHVLEDVQDAIPEEDIFNTDSSSIAGVLPATASSVIAAHAKMESLSDTVHSEGEGNTSEESPPAMKVTAIEPPTIVEPEGSGASSPNLLTLLEEPFEIDCPSDNVLQTATTCLIPVPVYECAAQEWLETPAQEWVQLAPEFGIVPQTTQPPISHAACKITQPETLTTAMRGDLLPTISVSRSSEESDDRGKGTPSGTSPQADHCDIFNQSVDATVEHRQQYSQDDLDLELRSSDTIATPRHSSGERHKRHLDKSTKRKGMYIDNSDWHQRVEPHRGLQLDISIANFQAIKPDSPDDNSPVMFEMNTPELEKGSPVWKGSQEKPKLLSSFSCQSSEEKDDASSSNNNSKTNTFLQTDSMSDTEERVSWSPTPSGDYDHKRYSKRPLTVRGPYGQMLEAELKKPNRMHFEEILEELRETDSLHSRSVVTKPSSGSTRSNMPQYSSSMRVRKSNDHLPVPSHARAASTPSQIEHVSKGPTLPISVSAKDLNETLSAADKLAQHQMKRAASEAPTSKTHHSKRSQSMSNDNKSQHHHNHHHHHSHGSKRNPDVSPTGSNKSKVPHATSVPPTAALLAELLKGSSENMLSEQRKKTIADTRSYVVQEIYRNEQSYVESLQTVVLKYLKVLKSPEHAGMIDTRTVDEIFFMVPDILEIHEKFLSELKQRLDDWDIQQKVGDAFMETFSKLEVLEVYTSFVNNCNRAKNAIRLMKHQRPSFSKFLESTAREHKGKLTLDNLLIKPVQKFPNYELLFQRLIKHTDHDHPDQKHLQDVLKLVHDILVHINCKEREIMENGQREATLRELEGVIEGITDLIAPERQFLLFDLVSMPSGQGARKDRGFFLFNDLLVLTSIKKRSGTIRKPNSSICPGSVATTLDTNKYKFLTKISLDCLEIVKTKDENIKRIVSEIENLAEDCNKLQQITDITASLKYPHQYLEDVIRELHRDIQRQLSERQTNDTQLNMLELTVSSPNGSQKLTVVFSKTEKRTNWEETFNDAKQKLAATLERHPIPEFLTSIPIRKTRAGLQFTCAAATLSDKRDVWVCNSDGYVGQVCIMSLHPEPNVTSCNGVCNARILCVASVPAYSSSDDSSNAGQDDKSQDSRSTHSYTQQLRDYRKSISPIAQPVSALTSAAASVSVSASALATPEKKKIPTPIIGNGADGASQSSTQLDLNLSSSDDEADAGPAVQLEQRVPSPAPSLHATYHMQQDSNPEESECNQSTMWIGTEDGCIHVYNSTDNIRIKKNRIKIEHHSAVFSILYLDNRVFVSLANGDICVYLRDGATSWNTSLSHCLSIGTVTSPVTKLLNVNGKLWCSIQGIIKVLDTESFSVINQIQISSDSKPITNMTVANNYVWISIQNSAHIKCFHSNTHQLITEVNLAPAVNKMLSNCDEIIRQHKAACLRVTSLLCCKDLIWIGTSAGVLLTIPTQSYEKGAHNIVPTGIPHGHTGHVRFLTFVETPSPEVGSQMLAAAAGRDTGSGTSDEYTKQGSTKNSKSKSETKNILIISGGDGYEDFRNSGANSLSEIAGREDSTNHLLIWQI
ncbi:uncharacterized protein LOC117790549 isoform X1 [Drosophila innubila]|uniref:uncharacterized protein LOC117790549 isoform X1 n=1 Tax=Drosophila innubila TaxID=198719 RepID=UPI00148D3388|nr:uncharacterized protein LOC117790549 isoform X1 [Drosophila innubila]